MAASNISHQADDDLEEMLDRILRLAWGEVHHKRPSREEQRFRLARIPGKGIGVVATCDIRKGELILVERHAMFVFNPKLREKHMEIEAQKAFPNMTQEGIKKRLSELVRIRPKEVRIQEVFDENVSPEFQSEIFNLDDSFREGGEKTLYGIFLTNCILAPANAWYPNVDDVCHDSLFLIASRFNHSCCPNIDMKFCPHGHVQYAVFTACRDIAAGQELGWSYCTMLAPSGQRNQELAKWHFTCLCSVCAQPKDELSRSDSRRRLLADMREKLGKDMDPIKVIMLKQLFLKILKEENLDWILDGAL